MVVAATLWEILWTVLAGSIVAGVLLLLIADALDGKVTWPGRIGALLFIPAGAAMAEGELIILGTIVMCMAALALHERRQRRELPPRGLRS